MATVTERPETRRSPTRTGGDRFVGIGLLLIAALFVAVQFLAGEIIPPLAVPAVLYAGVGVAALRWRPRWLLIAIVALLVLHVASSVPFLAAALVHPETPATFLPDAFVLIVAVAVAVGAIVGLRSPEARRGRLAAVAGALAVAAVVVSVVAAVGVSSEERQPGDVELAAERATFPERVVVPAGEATVWLENRDAIRHTFVVDGTDVHAEMPGATSVRVSVDLSPGAYRYFCDVPGHETMEGTLLVE